MKRMGDEMFSLGEGMEVNIHLKEGMGPKVEKILRKAPFASKSLIEFGDLEEDTFTLSVVEFEGMWEVDFLAKILAPYVTEESNMIFIDSFGILSANGYTFDGKGGVYKLGLSVKRGNKLEWKPTSKKKKGTEAGLEKGSFVKEDKPKD